VVVKSRFRDLLPIVFVSVFMNVAAPSGGASSLAMFVDDAVRRGQSAARTAAGTLLELIAELTSFTLVLSAGLIYLFQQKDLKSYEVIGALLLLAIVIALTGVLLMGLWQPSLLHRLLDWLQRIANRLSVRINHELIIPVGWAEQNTSQYIEAAHAILQNPVGLARTFLVALANHLVDIASIYVLFLAFHQPQGPGVLIAGYAIGILFWVVSITPQGIGVVEGVMTLVFTSLGVPAVQAAIVSLTFRGLTFWLPFLAGFLLLRKTRTFGGKARSRSESWGVHSVALLTGLMGMVNLLSAATPALAGRLAVLRSFSPLVVRRGSHLTAALAGFALILLADQLWRRKRLAWLLTLIVLIISSISYILKGLNYEEAALSLALAVWLVTLRHHFHARSDPPSVQQGLRVFVIAVLFTLTYGVAGFYMLDRHFRAHFGLLTALRQTIVMFTQFYDPGLQPITGFGRFFADSIYVVGALTLGYALFMLARPVLVRRPSSPAERSRAQAIVEAYGCTSLARYTLFPDKSYYFSPGGSLVAFVAKGRAAVALGDPIGPEQDIQEAIADFRQFCQRNDWIPAFYQVHPDYLDAYHAAGMEAFCVGMEGIVHLDEFSLEGRANKGLRTAVNHMTKLGYRAQLLLPPLSEGLMHELRSISNEWLTMVHGTEKRFSVGWFDDDYICNSLVMAIYTPDGLISAFANIVSEYQRNEITADLMRRRQDVEPGTMDFLFVSLFQWAAGQGYATFNLGLSALSGVGEKTQDPAIERALHYIYEHINQFYNFKGLHHFKEKFHPEWSPRYLIVPSMASLPSVAMAMAQADSGDNFVKFYIKDLTSAKG
jgi:phosphatidylglycerol lysyltransferase